MRGNNAVAGVQPWDVCVAGLVAVCLLVLSVGARAEAPAEAQPGVTYTNDRVAQVPWSIHVVRIERAHKELELHSVHAQAAALGLGTLSDQVHRASERLGKPVAAINGDFYQRDRAYAGDPRGLQIVDGELISGPTGGVSFWIDAQGEPHTTNVSSRFRITWPNGKKTSFGLNSERRGNGIEVYTPAAGPSTHTAGGLDLVLEREGQGPWLPLRLGETYKARVKKIQEGGDSPLEAGAMVVSVGPSLVARLPEVSEGAVLTVSTDSEPSLGAVMTALSGGPVLVRAGKAQKIGDQDTESYRSSSMLERHPRSAIGWNRTHFFLVEVDGRQRGSVGMTLEELGAYLVKLGCQEAMNLDGGGSATLWYDGRVRNRPCDGRERPVANSLVVVRRGE